MSLYKLVRFELQYQFIETFCSLCWHYSQFFYLFHLCCKLLYNLPEVNRWVNLLYCFLILLDNILRHLHTGALVKLWKV